MTWVLAQLSHIILHFSDIANRCIPTGPFSVSAANGPAGRGNTVIVTTEAHDAASQKQLVADLSDVYAAQRIETRAINSADDLRQALYTTYDTFAYLLQTMALLAAVLGKA